jgi:predicted HicB family RNase H-like nuclease
MYSTTIQPATHRTLVLEAAEQGIRLNRLASAKRAAG